MVEIKLVINDKDIPLNPIMSSLLTNITLGFIDVLKNIPEEKNEVNIQIKL